MENPAPALAAAAENSTATGAHVTRGARRVLEIPFVYQAFQDLLGSARCHARFVGEFVRPFPGAKILDVGCGTGSIFEHLPREIDYTGCDLNEDYLAAARQKHVGRTRFFQADLTDPECLSLEGEKFDIVMAVALLHHLDDDAARRLCAKVAALLKPGGRLVTLDGVYVRGQSRIAKYFLSRDRGTAVRTPEGYLALAGAEFGEITPAVVHDFLRVPYTHFVMNAVRA